MRAPGYGGEKLPGIHGTARKYCADFCGGPDRLFSCQGAEIIENDDLFNHHSPSRIIKGY